ncbi:MAG: hypothetical protein A2283_02085 [Lentisphaerae bacterium RIFOXYA12_FULL_48_11]|nr:MAG: hypothetical protein A2283_02085 [Lentisphaerae bacterium RIFOXYA12_FULL_48_11]
MASHKAWKTAFSWLETHASTADEGIHTLYCDGFHAKVMSYDLIPRELAKFESHRETIDIQFTVAGAEGIEISTPESLASLNDYDPVKEVEHFKTPDTIHGWVNNCQGYFTILFAGEPHMPKLMVPGNKSVKKVVIKLPVKILQP